ncbi:MAG: hypothetical protein AMXMBFR23_10000 [Chloroflexota bacterium]
MVGTPAWRPGALVSARGRTWVVLPPDEHDVIRLRPVDGHEDDAVGIFSPLEPGTVGEAHYPAPEPTHASDFAAALLLHDAARLKLRAGAGPFRSLGRVSVTPRPYQFVPLLMALRLQPIRLLIADDVGVGKTIEAALIARELMDRGVVRRIGVLCAPHLCEQWADELRSKFNVDAAVIQPARMARLERGVPRQDVNVFKYYRHIVASIDFVKSDRYRKSFLDNAPDLIIVDEAHTAARPRGDIGRSQHQRHELVSALAADTSRHLILASATPHSGVEESFRSLLGLLDPAFDVPEDEQLNRAAVARHFVQRKRADLRNWLGSDTPFPEREPIERSYRMSPEYQRLYEQVRDYCQEFVAGGSGLRHQQRRVRYWAATAILRCLLSSPAAASAMLQARSSRQRSEPTEDINADDTFAAQVLDSADEEEPSDYVPSAALDDPSAALRDDEIRRLDGFLRQAERLSGPELDHKLAEVSATVDELLSEGYRPIVYCRFIHTAQYVAEQLEQMLKKKHRGVRIRSVTGGDGDSELRREIVTELASEPVRVLVATDCLSEGINLQEQFDAVVHYDLPWNPNRLEQREGRVDRYGQRQAKVKAVLLYGADNPVDLTVLEVLIRKARTIRTQLGISVPVPVESEQVVQAIIDNVLLRRGDQGAQLALDLGDEQVSRFHRDWDEAAEREQQSRSRYAQHAIQPGEVAEELEELEPVLGSARSIRRFLGSTLQRVNGSLRETPDADVFELRPGDLQEFLKSRWPAGEFPLRVSFAGIDPSEPLPIPRDDVESLGRNHPMVEAFADYVLARSLNGDSDLFARTGATYTRAVDRRTAVYVLRLRYVLEEVNAEPQFAEEVLTVAARSEDDHITWLPIDEATQLLEQAQPAANITPGEREQQVAWGLELIERHADWYQPIVASRREALEASHARLRTAVDRRATARRLAVDPHLPPDVLGCFVLVPLAGAN